MPQLLYPRKRTTGTNWIIGWVGIRDALDAMVKRKNPTIAPNMN
jgi:hypothetical protein